MKWTVPKQQSLWQICACKYTKCPPYCDATHTNLPGEVLERRQTCPKNPHTAATKLCTGCGWVADFQLTWQGMSESGLCDYITKQIVPPRNGAENAMMVK